MEKNPKVSVIIPTMQGREDMLDRLKDSIPNGYEIIVVDDEDILLAAKRNKGAAKATGDFLLFIDDDNILDDNAIEEAVRVCKKDNVGAVGMMAFYDDDRQRIADGGSLRDMQTGFTSGINTNRRLSEVGADPYEVDEIANAFMIRRDVFEEMAGFDDYNFPIDLDEADFCRRAIEAGYRIVMCPTARCFHKSQTYSKIPNFRRPLNAETMGCHRIRYQRKFNSRLRFGVYLVFFMPVFVGYYWASLIWKRNPKMIIPFTRGVLNGLLNRRQN